MSQPIINTFALKIVSEETTIFDAAAKMVVVPGEEGDLGILPHHAPFIVRLKEGEVTLTSAEDKQYSYSIQRGWLDVSENTCTILIAPMLEPR